MISIQLQNKRHLIDGKNIVGIDLAKFKHQAAVIDPAGNLIGKSFIMEAELHLTKCGCPIFYAF
ncbi:TPA: hypothetical protein ENX78_16275 [Candidatus Poribacteria bacterium]|nr:hypothetical protein [Candidatus Poribacteria bacterium]